MLSKIPLWLGRLSVGRKLTLIYLLDLTAVIYVSGILIHEKYLAIDFARKEIVGAHYAEVVRRNLMGAFRVPPPAAASAVVPSAFVEDLQALDAIREAHDAELHTAEASQRLHALLQTPSSKANKTAHSPSSVEPLRAVSPRGKAQSSPGSAAATWLAHPHARQPTSPAQPITASCPATPGCHSVTAQATSINTARPGVAHRLRAMPHTACATTATATTLSPCTSPAPSHAPLAEENPSPHNASTSAEGSVKPSHAASAPPHPPRRRPRASPTWLLAGPGRNWHSATRSA